MENEIVRYDYEDKPIRSRAFRKQEKDRVKYNRTTTLLDKVFPGATMLSWQTTACLIWNWLSFGHLEDTHKAGLMPNLVIDHVDFPNQINNVSGRGRSMMHGETLWSFAAIHNDKMPMIATTTSEIRVYHRSLLQLIKTYWNGRAPSTVYQALMAHTLIHEMMHYVTMSKLWAAQFEPDEEDIARARFLDHLTNHIGTVEDEIANEAITLKLLKRLMLQGVDGPYDDGTLIPTMGGRYDLWKRERNPLYGERMDAYEVVSSLLGAYYLNNAGLNPDLDWDDRFWDIVDKQEKEARRNHEHVIVVD